MFAAWLNPRWYVALLFMVRTNGSNVQQSWTSRDETRRGKRTPSNCTDATHGCPCALSLVDPGRRSAARGALPAHPRRALRLHRRRQSRLPRGLRARLRRARRTLVGEGAVELRAPRPFPPHALGPLATSSEPLRRRRLRLAHPTTPLLCPGGHHAPLALPRTESSSDRGDARGSARPVEPVSQRSVDEPDAGGRRGDALCVLRARRRPQGRDR